MKLKLQFLLPKSREKTARSMSLNSVAVSWAQDRGTFVHSDKFGAVEVEYSDGQVSARSNWDIVPYRDLANLAASYTK